MYPYPYIDYSVTELESLHVCVRLAAAIKWKLAQYSARLWAGGTTVHGILVSGALRRT